MKMSRLETSFSALNDVNKKVFMSWKQLSDNITLMHQAITDDNFLPDAVVVLHKGGLIPGTMLAYRLKIDDIYVLKVSENNLVYPKDITNLVGKNIVIVDNIIQKGDKLIYIINLLQKLNINSTYLTCVIQKEYENPSTKPNFAAGTAKKDDWIIFPWEELNY